MIRASVNNVNRTKVQRSLRVKTRCCAKIIPQHSNIKNPRNDRACAARRKAAIEHSSKRHGARKAKQLSQDGRRCCVTVKNSGEMSSRNGGQAPGMGRRRGHQHHPRNEGTRGLTIQRQPQELTSAAYQSQAFDIVTEHVLPLNQDNKASDSKIKDVAAVVINVDNNKFSENILQPTTKCFDDENKSLSALVNRDENVVSTHERPQLLKLEEINMLDTIEDDKLNTKSSKNAANEKQKRHRSRSRAKGPRPAVEGGPGPQEESQDDPETQELARLRCTSERTELVAERENRRKNRCADYPGLAFGRSIFSSDTMMKFSIIKNELHNIMNAQLKRVRRRAIRILGYNNLVLPSLKVIISSLLC